MSKTIDEYFLEKKFSLQIDEGISRQFESFEAFQQFIISEYRLWVQAIPQLKGVHNFFNNLNGQLSHARSNPASLDSILDGINTKSQESQIFSESALGQFLLKNRDYAEWIIIYLFEKNYQTEWFKNPHFIEGFFRGFLFKNTDEVLDGKLEEGQKKLSKLRAEYDMGVQDVNSLKSTYEEKLKLEEPAQYWNKASKWYFGKSLTWLILCVALVWISYGFVHELLYSPPTWLVEASEKIDLSMKLRGYLLIGLGLTMLFYLLRLFVKLAFSEMHLARDAKERHHLTYEYLALRKGNAITEREREIIIQALFARSNTGLLKEDGHPSIVGEIVNKIGK